GLRVEVDRLEQPILQHLAVLARELTPLEFIGARNRGLGCVLSVHQRSRKECQQGETEAATKSQHQLSPPSSGEEVRHYIERPSWPHAPRFFGSYRKPQQPGNAPSQDGSGYLRGMAGR